MYVCMYWFHSTVQDANFNVSYNVVCMYVCMYECMHSPAVLYTGVTCVVLLFL